MYECKVETDTVVSEEIASVADDFDAPGFLFVATDPEEDFVVGEDVGAFLGGGVVGIPRFEKFVVVLVVTDGDRFVDQVSNRIGFLF